MSSQNEAFELLRADKGGASKPLIPIPMGDKGGYSIPYLKEIVTSNAAIYIRPMQHKLDLERTSQPSSPNYQVKTKCVNCGTEIPIQNLKEHHETCSGGGSKRNSSVSVSELDSTDNKRDKE